MPRPARAAASLVAVLALTTACAGIPTGAGGPYQGTPVELGTRPDSSTGPLVVPAFSACEIRPADPARTHLRPRTLTAADATVDPDRFGTIPVDGPLTVEDGGDLVLVDGRIDAGNAFEVGYGATYAPDVAVATGTVTAPVALSVLDSEESGRRVAFVEVRVGEAEPVTWEESTDLGFGTDGGDGGFLATGAMTEGVEVDGWDYVEAFFPEGDESYDNVCVERRTTPDGPMDGVLFSIGWGDGGYPVYLGRAADGTVVSVVCWAGITPWEWSGLPGTPPEDA